MRFNIARIDSLRDGPYVEPGDPAARRLSVRQSMEGLLMKRIAILIVVVMMSPVCTHASKLQQNLKSRWLGAWVVTTVETHSDCNGYYTANRVNGRLVSSRGSHRFAKGELAKVERVDLKRRRVDLLLTLSEPMLKSYNDGPFTLYDEVTCRMELEIEIPRDMVKSKDASSIDRTLAPLLDRFASLEQAEQSRRWNMREREDYPDDYEHTLTEYAIWKAEQQNALVRSRIDEALRVTEEITARVSSDSPYLSGFSLGIEAARKMDLGQCSQLLSADISPTKRRVSRAGNRESEMPPRVARGYQDGKRLVLGLEMISGLPECYVPVPDQPHRQR